MSESAVDITATIEDFRRARRRASVQGVLGRITGYSDRLLSYDEVRRQLRAVEGPAQGLRDIPLDAIVGSVGRYNDFTRGFLPRQDSDEQRWTRVKMAMLGLSGVPPIEVYQLGDVYFVRDGNHRVSVARGLGFQSLQGYVTEVHSRVPVNASISHAPDELIIKAEYVEFLEITSLDRLRPEADLTATAPGKYQQLLEHIAVHRYFLGLDWKRDISYEEAVGHWYDYVYTPSVQLIERKRLLKGFPGRTCTDLYLWLAEHHATLEDAMGWQLERSAVVDELAERISKEPRPPTVQVLSGFLDHTDQNEQREQRLIRHVMVALATGDATEAALEQALLIAKREGATLRGLHVVADAAAEHSPEVEALRQHFAWRCGEEGVTGQLAVRVGEVISSVCERAQWTDMLVLSVRHPDARSSRTQWSSNVERLLRRFERTVLVVPAEISPIRRLLLAFDASPQSEVALYVAAYLALRWQLPLVVTHVNELKTSSEEVLEVARQYLESHGVQAEYQAAQGELVSAVLGCAQEQHCDMVILGSYRYNPLLEVMLGGIVGKFLRESPLPLLICK